MEEMFFVVVVAVVGVVIFIGFYQAVMKMLRAYVCMNLGTDVMVLIPALFAMLSV